MKNEGLKPQLIADGPAPTVEDIPTAKPKTWTALSKSPKFNLLKPFKGLMRRALGKKGFIFGIGTSIAKIANEFYNKIVLRSKDSYGCPEIDFENSNWDNLSETATDSMISGILGYIVGVKNKSDAGGDLTKFEEGLAKQAGNIEETLKTKAQETVEQKTGSAILKNVGWIVVIVILAIVASRFAK